MLREIGVAGAKAPEPISEQRRFCDEYRRYLLQERGLAEATLANLASGRPSCALTAQ